ncbi:MAG TPA: hypothetical protein VKT80_18315, partial [Chloroflexota bacterium]|nr:hypothetical protein [Chloroflexota bacterium]
VSRARNSGSLKRHVYAALQSNGAWFLQFLFAVTTFNRIITGQYGWRMSSFAVVYYTAFTMSGSVYAHYRSLKTEKGLGAVGANKRYAQITVEEWEQVKMCLNPFPRGVSLSGISQEKWNTAFGQKEKS